MLSPRIAFTSASVLSVHASHAFARGCCLARGRPASVRPGSFSVLSRQSPLFSAPRSRDASVKPIYEESLGRTVTVMGESSGGTSVFLRAVAAVLLVGLIATSLGPLIGSLRTAATNSGDSLVDQKLHKVPVFTVTDTDGRPFLVEAEDHLSRRGYFFVDPIDAEAYLERVKDGTTDAKLLPVGLDDALKFVLERKHGSIKGVPEQFTLFPSERELTIAKDVTDNQFVSVFGEGAVPLFYVDGLAFAGTGDSSQTVYPVFFEKETLDKTLASLREKDAGAANRLGAIQVIDLFQTIKEIRTGSNPRLGNVVFLPLEDAVRTLQATSKSAK